MPFRSVKQRRFMWSQHPEIAKRWTAEYGSKVVKKKKKLRAAREKQYEKHQAKK